MFKLSNDKRLKFMKAVSHGSTYEIACGYAGVSYLAFKEWINSKDGEAFVYEIKKIEDEAILRQIRQVEKAANNGNKQARDWLRKYS